jgi:hypothetical protein
MKNEVNKKLIYIAVAIFLLVFSIFNPFLDLSMNQKQPSAFSYSA